MSICARVEPNSLIPRGVFCADDLTDWVGGEHTSDTAPIYCTESYPSCVQAIASHLLWKTKESHENLSVAETMIGNDEARCEGLQNLEILTNLLWHSTKRWITLSGMRHRQRFTPKPSLTGWRRERRLSAPHYRTFSKAQQQVNPDSWVASPYR